MSLASKEREVRTARREGSTIEAITQQSRRKEREGGLPLSLVYPLEMHSAFVRDVTVTLGGRFYSCESKPEQENGRVCVGVS